MVYIYNFYVEALACAQGVVVGAGVREGGGGGGGIEALECCVQVSAMSIKRHEAEYSNSHQGAFREGPCVEEEGLAFLCLFP